MYLNLRGPKTCTSDIAVRSLTDPVISSSLVDDRRSQYMSVYESAAAVTGYLIMQSIGVSPVEFISCILNLLVGSSPENDGIITVQNEKLHFTISDNGDRLIYKTHEMP